MGNPAMDAQSKPNVSARLKQGVELINQAVKERDTRAIVGRVLRETNAFRHELAAESLISFFKELFPEDSHVRRFLVAHLSQVGLPSILSMSRAA